jgi:hypothetical protein
LISNDSKTSEHVPAGEERRGGWIRVGAVAAASAVLGGLAAAWFYRKTLTQLQAVDLDAEDTKFRTTEFPEDEI